MVTKIESIANMFIYIILKNICHNEWYHMINELIYKIETDSQIPKTNLELPKEKCVENG